MTLKEALRNEQNFAAASWDHSARVAGIAVVFSVLVAVARIRSGRRTGLVRTRRSHQVDRGELHPLGANLLKK
jgi:hypothetical protein